MCLHTTWRHCKCSLKGKAIKSSALLASERPTSNIILYILLSVLKKVYQSCNMEQFILRYTWFTLNYIFKTLGLDLLKRDGEGRLIQTSACRFWIRVVSTYVVVNLLVTSTFWYILLVETTPKDFLTAYKEKFWDSKTNIYVYICNFLLFNGMTFFIIFKIRTLSRGLVKIQDYYKQNALIDEQEVKKGMKYFFFAIILYMAITTISVALVTIGSNTIVFSSLNVSTFWPCLLYIFTTLLFVIYSTPYWYFCFIYNEVSTKYHAVFSSLVRVKVT